MSRAKSARELRLAAARLRRRAQRLQAAALAAQRREAADEVAAPGAQRHAVLDASGAVYRPPTVTREGVTFRRSTTIAHLAARGVASTAQALAAERLLRAWEDGGRGVGPRPAGYGERSAGTPQSGWISDEAIASISYQTRARAEFAGAVTWLGALWPCARRVICDGIDVSAWGEETGRNPQAAKGYVMASLDRLAEFYAAVDRAREVRPRRHQAVVVVARTP